MLTSVTGFGFPFTGLLASHQVGIISLIVLPVVIFARYRKHLLVCLAREEALFAGTSSGANVVAAIRMAERLGPGSKVVTLMADSGLKYLSTDVYSGRRQMKRR